MSKATQTPYVRPADFEAWVDKIVETFYPLTEHQRYMRDCARAELVAIRAENARLRGALERHRHSDECLAYAARTARQHGNYHCIAACADSHRAALATETPKLEPTP